jgi:hypothetical protein
MSDGLLTRLEDGIVTIPNIMGGFSADLRQTVSLMAEAAARIRELEAELSEALAKHDALDRVAQGLADCLQGVGPILLREGYVNTVKRADAVLAAWEAHNG